MSQGESESDDAPAPVVSPRTNLKWQLRQRSSSRILAKMKQYGSRSEQAECTAPAAAAAAPAVVGADRAWRPRGRGRGRPRGSRRLSSRFAPQGRGRSNSATPAANSQQQQQQQQQQTTGLVEVKLERDSVPESAMDCGTCAVSASRAVHNSRPSPPLPMNTRKAQSKSFQVKAERIDPAYDKYETGTCSGSDGDQQVRNGSTETRQPFAKLRRLLVSRTESDAANAASKQAKLPESPPGGSTKKSTAPDPLPGGVVNGSSGHSNGTGGRTSSLNSVVDLLTVKQELQKTKEELASKSEENMELEVKLNEVNGELRQLKQTVSQQETQMADLASDFFELSNRFMKMSHKFKQALSDMKSPKINSN